MNLDTPDPIIEKAENLAICGDPSEEQSSQKGHSRQDIDRDLDSLERILRERLKSDACLDQLSNDLIRVLEDAVMRRVNSVPSQDRQQSLGNSTGLSRFIVYR